jgi:alginate O-acetyltransferase complex protein AlgI
LWGVYFALWIMAERYIYPGLLKRIPLLFCRIGTFLVVLGGFTIFVVDTPAETLALIRRMLDFSMAASDRILYLLSSNWLVIAIACLFATNAVSLLIRQLQKAAPRIASIVMGCVDLGLFAAFVALTF